MKTPAERLRQQLTCLIASRQSTPNLDPILETILIADGMYFGRRFHSDGFSLTFFAQEEHVKVVAPDGIIIYSAPLEQFLEESWQDQPQNRQAA